MEDDLGLTVASFIKTLLEEKKRKNSSYSMRAFSQKCGLPVSELSKVMRGEKVLSPFNAHKIINSLDLGRVHAETFLNRVFFEMEADRSNQSVETRVDEKYIQYNIICLERLRRLKEKAKLKNSYTYQMKDTFIQRSLVFLEDSNGRAYPDFYDIYVNPERELASPSYFFRNDEKVYSCVCFSYFNQFTDPISMKNRELNIKFDSKGFPSISGMYIRYDREDKYFIADLIYTDSQCKMLGKAYDGSGQLIENTEMIYFRV